MTLSYLNKPCFRLIRLHSNSEELIRTFSVQQSGFKFNFFDGLLKLASGIIFYLLNLSTNLLFHTYISTPGKNFSRQIFFLIFPRKRVLKLGR